MAKCQELQLIGSRISLRGIKANAVGKHILSVRTQYVRTVSEGYRDSSYPPPSQQYSNVFRNNM